VNYCLFPSWTTWLLTLGSVRLGRGGGPPPHNGVRVVGFLKLYVEGELLFVSELDNVVINLMVG